MITRWKTIGTCTVENGQIMLVDLEPGSDWSKFMRSIMGTPTPGANSGEYPVEARYKSGNVETVRIKFD